MGLNDYCKLRAHMDECSFEPSIRCWSKWTFSISKLCIVSHLYAVVLATFH